MFLLYVSIGLQFVNTIQRYEEDREITNKSERGGNPTENAFVNFWF